MRINHLSPLYPTDPRAPCLFGDTQHRPALTAYHGCQQDAYREECPARVRVVVGSFPLVVQERLLHTVAKNRVQPPHLFPAKGYSRAFRNHRRKGQGDRQCIIELKQRI